MERLMRQFRFIFVLRLQVENLTLQAESEMFAFPFELEPPAEKFPLKVDCLSMKYPEWVGFECCAIWTNKDDLDNGFLLFSCLTVL